MENRRTFLELAVAALLPIDLGAERAQTAQTTPRAESTELARHALTGPFEGFEAVLTLGTVPGVATSNPHRHPSFSLSYVLEGQLRVGLNYEEPQTIPAGGTFFEPMGVVHSAGGSGVAGLKGRRLTFTVTPKGAPAVLPV